MRRKHRSLKHHLTLTHSPTVYYVLLASLILPLLVTFFIAWFVPYYQIGPWMKGTIAVTAALQLACTFIPEIGGHKLEWQRIRTCISSFLLIPILFILLIPNGITGVVRGVVLVSLFTMATCIYTVVIHNHKPHNFLFIQCVYFAAFFAPIIMISYLH